MTFLVTTQQGRELMTANESDAYALARHYSMQTSTVVSVQRVLPDEDGTLLPLGPSVQVGLEAETP